VRRALHGDQVLIEVVEAPIHREEVGTMAARHSDHSIGDDAYIPFST
jgi:hypothetical protein